MFTTNHASITHFYIRCKQSDKHRDKKEISRSSKMIHTHTHTHSCNRYCEKLHIFRIANNNSKWEIFQNVFCQYDVHSKKSKLVILIVGRIGITLPRILWIVREMQMRMQIMHYEIMMKKKKKTNMRNWWIFTRLVCPMSLCIFAKSQFTRAHL